MPEYTEAQLWASLEADTKEIDRLEELKARRNQTIRTLAGMTNEDGKPIRGTQANIMRLTGLSQNQVNRIVLGQSGK